MEAELDRLDTFGTTNQTYGQYWEAGPAFQDSFTQSRPYKDLTNTRQVGRRLSTIYAILLLLFAYFKDKYHARMNTLTMQWLIFRKQNWQPSDQ